MGRRLALIALALLALSPRAHLAAARDAPPFHIQAHRGAGIAMPENTLESFEWSWTRGITPEADLRLSKDGHIVCFHDPDFKRVPTNADAATKKLGVEKLTLAELQKLDVGSFRGHEFALQRIPTLDSVLAQMHGHPERMLYLDIKTVDMDRLAEMVRKYGVERQTIFTSTKYNLIRDWKKRVPESPTLLWNGGTEAELTKKLAAVREQNFEGITHLQIHVHVGDLNSSEPFNPSTRFLQVIAKELKSRGIVFQILPWECSDQRAYEKLLALGAESFATDYAEVTLAAVRNYHEKEANDRGR